MNLANFKTIYRQLLNLPKGDNWDDGNPPLINFSPNLELILVGNALLEIGAPKAEPLYLPIPEISGSKLRGFLGEYWTCTFSACSTYIALLNNPDSTGQFSPELTLFHFDMQRKTCVRYFKEIRVAQYYMLTVDFHPHSPEMVLNGWIKGDPAVGSSAPYRCDADKIMDMTTLLLDFENKTLINLGNPAIHRTLYDGKTKHRFRISNSLLTLSRLLHLELDFKNKILSMRVLRCPRLGVLQSVIVAHSRPLQALHNILS